MFWLICFPGPASAYCISRRWRKLSTKLLRLINLKEIDMTTTVSLINMKGGVGKTTLAFNLAWYCAWRANLKVLAVDLDPQANLSQYSMGARKYLANISTEGQTVVEIFEQFSAPRSRKGSPRLIKPSEVLHVLQEWSDGSLLHLVPSRLELAWTLKNPTEKAQ